MPQILEKTEAPQAAPTAPRGADKLNGDKLPSDKIKVWTYDDYAQLPENGAPELHTHIHYELLEGELIVSPAPNFYHQKIVSELLTVITNHIKQNALGIAVASPVDVVLSPTDTPQPDLIFISNERRGIITPANIQGAPDLVVEIISPTSDRRDRQTKWELYARSGVPFYWIVDPRLELLEEYELRGEAYYLVREWKADESFAPQLFPGLHIMLDEVFAPV